jgi:hypothetical protein
MALARIVQNVRPSNGEQNVLDWTWPKISPQGQLDPYCEDQESKTINITLDSDVVGQEVPLTDTTESAFWTIRWSAGNMTQVVECDLQRGTYLTVVGNVVSIQISYPIADAILGAVTQPLLDVRATLGFDGGRPSAGVTSIPRRSQRIGAVGAGVASAIFPIPRFAVAAFMRNSNITVPTLVFSQFRGNAAANAVSIAPIGKLSDDTVPVAAGARFFQVVNTGAVGATDVSVVFLLGI